MARRGDRRRGVLWWPLECDADARAGAARQERAGARVDSRAAEVDVAEATVVRFTVHGVGDRFDRWRYTARDRSCVILAELHDDDQRHDMLDRHSCDRRSTS